MVFSTFTYRVCGFVLLFLTVNAADLDAQKWQRLAVDLHDVVWVAESTIVAVGDHGVVLRSSDGGRSWNYAATGVSDNLYKLYFFNDADALAAGENGRLLSSSDGGKHWSSIELPTGEGHIFGLDFPNSGENGLIATTRGNVLLTTDHGASWSLRGNIEVEVEKFEFTRDLVFLSDSVCVVSTSRGRIMRSSDFGMTWESVFTDTLIRIHDVDYHDGIAIAVGGSVRKGIVLRSRDEGMNWEELGIDELDFRAYSVRMLDSHRIVIGGQRLIPGDTLRQRLVYTSDGGESWRSREVGNHRGFHILSSVWFSSEDPDRGVAVGTHHGIYLTEDGGESWEERSYARIYHPVKASFFRTVFYGAHFFNQDTGIVYGHDGYGNGYTLRTTDGGTTWQSIIYAIAIVRDVHEFTNGVMIGLPDDGSLWNIDRKMFSIGDYGATWSFQEKAFDQRYRYDFTSEFTEVLNEEILSFTADSMIFESTDKGESWRRIAAIPGAIDLSDLQYRGKYGWVVANKNRTPGFWKGAVMRCDIGDRAEWQTLFEDSGAHGEGGSTFGTLPTALWFIDERTGFMGHDNGKLQRTSDAGQTWDSVAQFDRSVNTMRFFSDSVGLIVSGLSVMHTTDGGTSWREVSSPALLKKSGGFVDIELLPDQRTVILSGLGLEGVIVRGEFPDKLTSVESVHAGGDHIAEHTLREAVPNPLKRGSPMRLRIGGNENVIDNACDYTVYNTEGRVVLEERNIPLSITEGDVELYIETTELLPGEYFMSIRTKRSGEFVGRAIVIE